MHVKVFKIKNLYLIIQKNLMSNKYNVQGSRKYSYILYP
jgi:hypothetical protein